MKQVFKYGKSDLILSVNFYNDTFILRFLIEKANTFFFFETYFPGEAFKKTTTKVYMISDWQVNTTCQRG